jgi:hypothetical protein
MSSLVQSMPMLAGIVYVVLGGDIDVIAVAHAKRRPAYWRRRGA